MFNTLLSAPLFYIDMYMNTYNITTTMFYNIDIYYLFIYQPPRLGASQEKL